MSLTGYGAALLVSQLMSRSTHPVLESQVTSVPLYRPLIADSDLAAVGTAMESGLLGMGSVVASFEDRLRTVLGLGGERHLAAVSTGHAALHLALVLAGIGPGDEVITPSLTHLADVQAIAAVGATPVFCDIDDR